MKTCIRIILTMALFFSMCGSAWSAPWSDTVKHWEGWGNGSSEDGKDTIGDPQFMGGEVLYGGNNLLSKITVEYTKHDIWNIVKDGEYFVAPGDLFLDIDADNNWDYVAVAPQRFKKDAASWDLYSVDLPFDLRSSYRFSENSHLTALDEDDGRTRTYDIRNDHPIAVSDNLTLGDSLGLVGFGGLQDPGDLAGLTYWDFSGLDFGSSLGGLDVGGDSFIFGFAARCGNDVVYHHAPIPAAVWMLGSGILGLVTIRRKYKA